MLRLINSPRTILNTQTDCTPNCAASCAGCASPQSLSRSPHARHTHKQHKCICVVSHISLPLVRPSCLSAPPPPRPRRAHLVRALCVAQRWIACGTSHPRTLNTAPVRNHRCGGSRPRRHSLTAPSASSSLHLIVISSAAAPDAAHRPARRRHAHTHAPAHGSCRRARHEAQYTCRHRPSQASDPWQGWSDSITSHPGQRAARSGEPSPLWRSPAGSRAPVPSEQAPLGRHPLAPSWRPRRPAAARSCGGAHAR